MNSTNSNLYSQSGTTPSASFPGNAIVATQPPTSSDIRGAQGSYPIGQLWVDKINQNSYQLVALSPSSGTVSAVWERLTGGGSGGISTINDILPDEDGNFEIQAGSGITITPDTNAITIAVSSLANPVDSVQVDNSTPPGTDPVLPITGVLTLTGGQVAAGTTVNTIRTASLAAGSCTIQVQRSTDEAVSTVGSNGVCHFDSTNFSVDANGFVTFNGGAAGIQTINTIGPTGGGNFTIAAGANITITPGANQISIAATGGGGSGINTVNVQVFTSNGTYTPTVGMSYAWVQMVGGGGGAGGASVDGGAQSPAGSGGGSGYYASKVFDAATIGASQAVTIGAGGAGGTAAADGADGTATSLGTLLSVDGGVRGMYMRTNGPTQEGGDGGQAYSGSETPDYSTAGGGGQYAIYIAASTLAVSGSGGSNPIGNGGKARAAAANGENGGGYGSGGSGAVASAGTPGNGGDGADGVVIVTEYIG